MRLQRRGFTLIELLVVIAIIGILAAMLFPVFARARESARKIQCLSNVKNIALAVQMYLTDYDALPGGETNPAALAEFCDDAWTSYAANPYLRWAVVLDEYIKNREVWKCPSAKMTNGAGVMIPLPDYLTWWKLHEGEWPNDDGIGPCKMAFPAGWGGQVTDTIVQGWVLGSTSEGGFIQTIGVIESYKGLKSSNIGDPASYVCCGDSGGSPQHLMAGTLAYPDICCISCSAGDYATPCGSGVGLSWENCSGTDCWDSCISIHADPKLRSDPNLRKPYARHMGGVNVGYMDGHASWSASDALLARYGKGEISGLDYYGPTSQNLSWGCWDPNTPVLF